MLKTTPEESVATTIAKPPLLVYNAAACRSCLDAYRGRIGNYDPLIALLRARARRVGGMPYKLHDLLKRWVNPRKPYFIGQVVDGVQFLGDFRERHAVLSTVFPDHDAALPRFIRSHVEGGGKTFIDVGANIGIVAASVARSLKDGGIVVAFEPLPHVAVMAACTMALNNLTNVHIVQCAVSDSDGEIVFYHVPGHSEWSTTNPTAQIGFQWEKTTVPTRTLDTLMDQDILTSVDFIKVDVEGHEPKVFHGAQRLLDRHLPKVLYEYNFDAAEQAKWTIADASVLLRGGDSAPTRPYQFEAMQNDGHLEPVSASALERGRCGVGHVDIFCVAQRTEQEGSAQSK